jgi:hypothetical protein
MRKEVWATIPGHGGYYEVSNCGRVRNSHTNTPIKPTYSNYDRVRLYYVKPSRSYLVHRLVAQAFLSTRLDRPEVNHKNFNRRDNRIENLEWATRKDNVAHAKPRISRGEISHLAKLTTDAVRGIRREREAGAALIQIADKYNITSSNVSAIALRKSWRHI